VNAEPAQSILLPDVTLLCGGLGTRLRGVIADRPKVLAPVAGKPFLAWVLDRLATQGFKRVILCTGFLAEQIEAEFGAEYKELDLEYSLEPSVLGTGGALRHALPLIESPSTLIMNGDSYCHVDLVQFCLGHDHSHALASMVLVNVDDSGRFGSVKQDGAGRVLAFQEKTASAVPGWINAGIYLINRSLLHEIPAGKISSLERDYFPPWINRGLRGFTTEGPFIDIGTPESYASAEAFFQAKPAAALLPIPAFNAS